MGFKGPKLEILGRILKIDPLLQLQEIVAFGKCLFKIQPPEELKTLMNVNPMRICKLFSASISMTPSISHSVNLHSELIQSITDGTEDSSITWSTIYAVSYYEKSKF